MMPFSKHYYYESRILYHEELVEDSLHPHIPAFATVELNFHWQTRRQPDATSTTRRKVEKIQFLNILANSSV